MPYTVVGTFDSRAETEPAVQALTNERAEPLAVVVHEGRLETLDLPDSGTEVGRNMIIANASGIAIGGTMGAVGSIYVPGLALDPLEGFVLGAIAGFFTAYITALMSGTRDAKGALRELEAHIDAGGVILSVDTSTRATADEALRLLDEHGAETAHVL